MTAAAETAGREVSALESRRLVLGAYLGMIGLAACTSPLAVCLTSLSVTFPELTTAGLGFLSTVILAGVVTGLLLAGPLADHWGLRPFMILGEALEVAALVATALAPTVPVLWAAMGLVGIGAGLVDGLASPLVAQLQPRQRTRALNWLHSCYPLGFLLMGAVAAVLLRSLGDWRAVFPVVSLPALAALALFLTTRFPRSPVQGEGWAALRAVLPGPSLWIGLVAIALAGATEMGLSHWTPTYVERALGQTREEGAAVVLGMAAGMLVGRLGVGALAPRVRPVRLMLAAAGICAGTILTAGLAPAKAAMAAVPLLGLAVACLWPTVMALTADSLPRAGATVFPAGSRRKRRGGAGARLHWPGRRGPRLAAGHCRRRDLSPAAGPAYGMAPGTGAARRERLAARSAAPSGAELTYRPKRAGRLSGV